MQQIVHLLPSFGIISPETYELKPRPVLPPMLLLGQTSILRSNLLGSCSYVVRGFWVDLAINASFMVIAYRLPNLL